MKKTVVVILVMMTAGVNANADVHGNDYLEKHKIQVTKSDDGKSVGFEWCKLKPSQEIDFCIQLGGKKLYSLDSVQAQHETEEDQIVYARVARWATLAASFFGPGFIAQGLARGAAWIGLGRIAAAFEEWVGLVPTVGMASPLASAAESSP